MIAGEEIVCTILKCVYGGDGLARVSNGEFVVFVSGGYPDEKVRAKIISVHKNFARAEVVEILEPSPERIENNCGIMEHCGAVYSRLAYTQEIKCKVAQLKEFLNGAERKTGAKLPEVESVASPVPLNYRNKITLFSRNGMVGFMREKSHDIADADFCPLARNEINDLFLQIRNDTFESGEGKTLVRYTQQDGVKWWTGKPPRNERLYETTCGETFEVSASGFYQVNPIMGDKLVGALRDAYIQDSDCGDIVELYGGVGVFGLICKKANPDASLAMCESFMPAVSSAKRNALRIGVKGRFYCSDSSDFIKRAKINKSTTIIADPPRAGMGDSVCKSILKSGAGRLLLVSCNPSTLARDLSVLLEKYEMTRIRMFDLFSRTAGFESFAELKLKGDC